MYTRHSMHDYIDPLQSLSPVLGGAQPIDPAYIDRRKAGRHGTDHRTHSNFRRRGQGLQQPPTDKTRCPVKELSIPLPRTLGTPSAILERNNNDHYKGAVMGLNVFQA
jgi:hypothetical protein